MQRKPVWRKWLEDPPPSHAFEISEAGIAAAQTGKNPKIWFTRIESDVIQVSPIRDNVLRPEALAASVRGLASTEDGRRKRRALLILPDYSARVVVLDFDGFPSEEREQASLIRFRLKRSVPFDIETARLSFQVQAGQGQAKHVEVVVAVAAPEIVGRYEAPFRAAGYQVGWVTTSSLAAAELLPAAGTSMLVKRTGRVLSLLAMRDGVVKVIRAIEMEEGKREEIASHVFPTVAYVEDQVGATPDMLLVCGFGPETDVVCRWLSEEVGVRTQPLRSPFGVPSEVDAGLHGYLASLAEHER